MGEYAACGEVPPSVGERTFFRGGVGSGVQQYSASLLQKFLPAGIFDLREFLRAAISLNPQSQRIGAIEYINGHGIIFVFKRRRSPAKISPHTMI